MDSAYQVYVRVGNMEQRLRQSDLQKQQPQSKHDQDALDNSIGSVVKPTALNGCSCQMHLVLKHQADTYLENLKATSIGATADSVGFYTLLTLMCCSRGVGMRAVFRGVWGGGGGREGCTAGKGG